MRRVEGKTALVTGASRGIGRAIAIELAREGAKVAINYTNRDAKAKEVAEEIGKLGGTGILYKADVANPKEVRAMVTAVADEFKHLDILVNNAGITLDCLLPRMTDEQWIQVIQTNLCGCFYCTSAVIPIMNAQSYGRIVNVSSINGQVPAMGQANYSASKGGIIAFTRTAALELVNFGITVNAVCPAILKPIWSKRCPRHCRRSSKARFRCDASVTPRKSLKRYCFLWRTEISSPASRSMSMAAHSCRLLVRCRGVIGKTQLRHN